ncbi:hypothetical protein AIA08_003777 [Salmonella enterica subsp. enterica serovar Wichita]|nr:hypothetical protein [Salmonella enterica subsp. enterica serovar Wichita]
MTTYTNNSSEATYNRSVDYTDSRVKQGNTYAIDVSKSYTDQSSQKTLNQATTYTDNRFNQSIDYTNSQINSVNGRINNLDSKVDDNRKKASAGIAGAMAMSAIPQNFSYDFNFGMGMSNFDSEQAISAGGYYRVNERTTVSLKTSFDTQNNLGAAAGISYGW